MFGAGDPVFLVLFFGGILFFVAACVRAWKTRRFAAASRPAEGTVIRFEQITDVEGPNTDAPVVRFKPEAGEEIEFTDAVSGSWPPVRIGDRVRVLYDPGNARNAHIASAFRLYLGVWVVMIIGLALAGIGAGGYLAAHTMPESATVSATSTMDFNTSRRHGEYYRSIELDIADAEACRDACAENVFCRAWTYVKPNPANKERQWCQFQSDTPTPVWDQCCISGEIRR